MKRAVLRFILLHIRMDGFSMNTLFTGGFISFILLYLLKMIMDTSLLDFTDAISMLYLTAVILAATSHNPFEKGQILFARLYVSLDTYIMTVCLSEIIKNIVMMTIFSIVFFLFFSRFWFESPFQLLICLLSIPVLSTITLIVRSSGGSILAPLLIFGMWVSIPAIMLLSLVVTSKNTWLALTLPLMDCLFLILLYYTGKNLGTNEGMGKVEDN